ncbi:GntR family transcriptional regulator, partial [Priestia sp. SIMBA_032]
MATDAIRKKILSGELAPGARLIEERLTEELAISRPPLREALR